MRFPGAQHQHFSIETLDNTTGTPSINSHLTIDYGSNLSKSKVTINKADFVIGSIANFNINSLIKFTPNTTLDIYPNNQNTIALRISNNSKGTLLSSLGGSWVSFGDSITTTRDLNATANTLESCSWMGNYTFGAICGNGKILAGLNSTDQTIYCCEL